MWIGFGTNWGLNKYYGIQGLEEIRVERVGDELHPVRPRNVDVRTAADAHWENALSCRRLCRPVHVRDTELGRGYLISFPGSIIGVERGDVFNQREQDLLFSSVSCTVSRWERRSNISAPTHLVKGKVWPVPSQEKLRDVCAVTRVFAAGCGRNAVPLSPRDAVNA